MVDTSGTYQGIVVSYSGASKWGFIACGELAPLLGGKDVFFHTKDCSTSNIAKGQSVTFKVDLQGDGGKPQARNISGGENSLAVDPPGAVRYIGTVVSYVPASAWGFIKCEEAAALFGGKDVFFHVKDCNGEAIGAGQVVSFILDEESKPGKPQAKNVQGIKGAVGADTSGQMRYQGTVGSYTPNTAWGFITCPEVTALLGKDVFFHNKDCIDGQITKGCSVSFVLDTQGDNGKPQAKSLKVVGEVPTPFGKGSGKGGQQSMMMQPMMMQPMMMGGQHQGMVQSFSPQAGWGFIESPTVGLQPGKGIFFHIKDCIGFSDANAPQKGALVSFVLGGNSNGKPQAVNVTAGGASGGMQLGGQKRTMATMNMMGGMTQVQQMQQMQQMEQMQKRARAF